MKHTSAYKSLIQYALDKGATVYVFSGTESWGPDHRFDSIVDRVEQFNASTLEFYNPEGIELGWASIIPELDDNEQVADYGMTPFMEEWLDKFIDGEGP
jgi:hypothetical protein